MFTAALDGGDHQPWPQERLTITPLGRAVLAGTVDWLSLRPPARWLGGVLIPRAGPWLARWDGERGIGGALLNGPRVQGCAACQADQCCWRCILSRACATATLPFCR